MKRWTGIGAERYAHAENRLFPGRSRFFGRLGSPLVRYPGRACRTAAHKRRRSSNRTQCVSASRFEFYCLETFASLSAVVMGKSPGHVERSIDLAFAADAGAAFSVDELCRRIYRGIDRVEKKHRVAVLRAAKARAHLAFLSSHLSGGALIFFILGSVTSYGLARLKA